MSSFYAWVVPEGLVSTMNTDDGVSPCYTLPILDLPSVQDLPDARVFIIVRSGKNDYIFARIVVDSVELCEDEIGNTLGHLLNVDIATSFRVMRSCTEVNASEYKTELFKGNSTGLSRITSATADLLDKHIRATTHRLIKHFTEREFSRINPPISRCCASQADKVLRREIALHFPISELWGSQSVQNPIAHLALEYLKRNPNFVLGGNITDVIARLEGTQLIVDETATPFASKQENKPFAGHVNTALPDVDLSLVPVNPAEIKIRRFVARRRSIPIDEMLQKTAAAEKRHQEMLKDIAAQLLKNGHNVFQSESIDMAVKSDAGLHVYELKSIDGTNAVSQIAKGLFQLLYYSDALKECGISVVEKGLIVESNLTEDMSNAFSRIVGNAGVCLYLYNSKRQWPERVSLRLGSVITSENTVANSHNLMLWCGGAVECGDSTEGAL